ncbi:retropepsin-like aspartic protease [Marinifilum sp. D737]|uniref:retropepsin-like aspartic protease n=1 Tax=Marinifilum sp. D737 TaxID=2969628 RepID=UPI00227479A8|nr:retropepsin-like aspartic protease [Marinifilum sp. D737]MCY1634533.1 retroviral-like aspartic protease family protein [Marinifilum sp. D737]
MIEIPIEIVELEENSFHLMIECEINSGQKGEMVIDTGASKTVLDKNFVDDYQKATQEESEVKSRGLGEGSIETEMAKIDRFQIGTLCINHFSCALIDLSGINEMYRQYCNREICGLLGSDFLLKYNGIIDYRRRVLQLNKE